MKRFLQQLIADAENGDRLVDGQYISERRISTYKLVEKITPEIAPGPESKAKLEKLFAQWRKRGLKDSTIKVYAEVLRMVPGDYSFPELKVAEREPQHIPVEVAERILVDPLPEWADTPALRACWTATKLSLCCVLRPGDSLSVTKDNIAGTIILVRHQKRRRIVRGSLLQSVADYIAAEIHEHGDVYPAEFTRLGLAYRKRQFTAFVRRLLDHYGIADDMVFDTADGKVKKVRLGDVITAHSLRATAVAVLKARNVPTCDIKAIGGWSPHSLVFTKHYEKPNVENIWK